MGRRERQFPRIHHPVAQLEGSADRARRRLGVALGGQPGEHAGSHQVLLEPANSMYSQRTLVSGKRRGDPPIKFRINL